MTGPVHVKPLRGRRFALDRAVRFLEQSKETGQGAIITVAGEPGIGKTAFLNTVVDCARDLGFSVGMSKAEEHDQIAPLAPLLVALRSGSEPLLTREEFAELAPLYHQHLWLVDRLTSMLEERSLKSSVLVVIDDVQWADQLTVFALRVMPGRLAGSAVVWLLSTRLDPIDAMNKIVAGQAPAVSLEPIALGPLDPAAIEELALDRRGERPSGLLLDLLQSAEGFPFLAVELLDGFTRGDAAVPANQQTDIPARLIDGVRSRLSSLSEDALHLVQIGSVLGRSFDVEDAAALLQIDPWTLVLPALAVAVRAGVLEEDGTQVAFRHDLFRRAVYEDVSPLLRKALHRAAALQILETGRSVLDVIPHVLLYAGAGDIEAVNILRQAAASQQMLPSVASQLLERAFALLNRSHPSWPAVGRDYIRLLIAARHVRQATKIADEVLATHVASEAAAAIQILVIRGLWQTGHVDEMRERLESAARLSDLSDGARAELQSLNALARCSVDDWPTATISGEAALTIARSVKSHDAEADALRALGEASRNDGRNDNALRYFRELRVVIPETSTVDESISLQLIDKHEESRALISQARSENERSADRSKTFGIAFAQMWHDFIIGEIDKAEAEAKTLVQLSEDFQDNTYQHEAQLILCRVEQLRGNFPMAREHLALSAAHQNDNDNDWRQRLIMGQAWVEESAGNNAEALALTRKLLYNPGEGHHRWRWLAGWLVIATRIAVLAPDRELSEILVVSARELAAKNPGVPSLAATAMHIRGFVDMDLTKLNHAAKLMLHCTRPIVYAQTMTNLAHAAIIVGESAASVAALEIAFGVFSRHEAHGEARRAQQMLQKAGVRRRQKTPRALEGWKALTGTEEIVARLIADGNTNRVAATELGMSPNTVATHLRSIFGKLTVNSRSQLTRVVVSEHSS